MPQMGETWVIKSEKTSLDPKIKNVREYQYEVTDLTPYNIKEMLNT